MIADSGFRSLKAFPTGLDEDGELLFGYLTVEFRGGIGRYSVADFRCTERYRCDADAILAGPATGRYDAARKILVWNGNEYERVR